MVHDPLPTTERKPISWYDDVISVRGCHISLENIKDLFRDLQSINSQFGEKIIAQLNKRENMTDDQWKIHKEHLLSDAFCLTTTINTERDIQIYGENISLFDDSNIKYPIKSIFFTNVNSYKRNANGDEPINRFTVFVDFSKPAIFDPNILVSSATPNNGRITISAQDIMFFNAVQKSVEKHITSKKSWYSPLHQNFSYDLGMWLFALPISLYFSTFYMNEIIPENSQFSLFRWPLFLYFGGLSLIIYRTVIAYAKWAFPVNVLVENKDTAYKHRLALAGFASWMIYQVASTVYSMIVQ